MNNKIKTQTINSILIAITALVGISILSMTPAYAMVSSNLSEFSEDEAKHITHLAKKVEFLTEKIATLEGSDKKNSEKRIVQLQNNLDRILDELNPLGFYSHEQYYEEIKNLEPEEDSSDGISSASHCGECQSMQWRAGFQYKLWGITADTHGSWKSSAVLNVPLTSTATSGYFVPDWIKPYAQAYQIPTTGGDLEYTLKANRQSGTNIHDYGNNIVSVQGSTWLYPTQWTENSYSNVYAYDRVVMVGNVESWS